MLLRLAKPSTTTAPPLLPRISHLQHRFSTAKTTNNNSDDSWNDAWETAWLPNDDDVSNKTTPTPWDSINEDPTPQLPIEIDTETKAFVAEMNENWDDRRGKGNKTLIKDVEIIKIGKNGGNGGGLYSLENVKKDYRLKKQRIHAGLWVKEIDKLEESKLGVSGDTHEIDKLLDSCSEIFDSGNNDVNNPRIPGTSEFKNKPDGWEIMSKAEDGSVWEMSQREEDILLQEFERRMAFCKYQIASFIKTHIFSRRRPIDGWKYMIEVIGPNAKKGNGSVSRLPTLTDSVTQAFTEDRKPTTGGGRLTSPRRQVFTEDRKPATGGGYLTSPRRR